VGRRHVGAVRRGRRWGRREAVDGSIEVIPEGQWKLFAP